MNLQRLLIAIKEIWFRIRIAIMKFTYKTKTNRILERRQNKIRAMWKSHKDEQIKDLVVCIDYKFRLIGKLFSDELRADLQKHRDYCIRNKRVRELKILSDILYLQNIEMIELQLQQITKQRIPR